MSRRSGTRLVLCSLALVMALSSASIAATLEGRVMYNGQPVSNCVGDIPVQFWVRDEDTGQAITVTWDYWPEFGSIYRIYNLPPGRYGIQSYIPAATPNGFFPGNYYSWFSPITVPPETEMVYQYLPINRLIHLTSPIDNSYPQHWGPYDAFLEGYITFEWQPIAEAATYEIFIYEYQCCPRNYIRLISHAKTDQTSVAIPLNRNLEGHYYEFSLYAYNDSGVYVGQFMIVYDGVGYGWDYRFFVGMTPESITRAIVNLKNGAFTNNATQRKTALSNKLREIQLLIDRGYYQEALDKLVNDIQAKMDGCFGGNPKDDWITDCPSQDQLFPLVNDLIAYLQGILSHLAMA